MTLEAFVVKKVIELLADAIKRVSRGKQLKSKEKRCAQLISEAVRELLEVKPDLHAARAKLKQAESISSGATQDLSRAQAMLEAVASGRMIRPGLPDGVASYFDLLGMERILPLLQSGMSTAKKKVANKKMPMKKPVTKAVKKSVARKTTTKKKTAMEKPVKKLVKKSVATRKGTKKKTTRKKR